MLTSLAVLLVGVYLIIVSQSRLSDVATLIFGAVVAILALVDLVQGPIFRRQPS